jgi:hypothetical protein
MKDLVFGEKERSWSGGYSGGYIGIVESFGYKILAEKDVGHYQGTLFYLLHNEDQVGLLDVNYGSCSGCDSLQACDTKEDVLQLRQDIFDSIKWYTPEKLEESLLAKETSRYSFSVDVVKTFSGFLPKLKFSDTTKMLVNNGTDSLIVADSVQDDGYDELATVLRMDRGFGWYDEDNLQPLERLRNYINEVH